ncbi:MAG: hypothetical protein CYG59_11700, partial [Chloroflexi bacterium]
MSIKGYRWVAAGMALLLIALVAFYRPLLGQNTDLTPLAPTPSPAAAVASAHSVPQDPRLIPAVDPFQQKDGAVITDQTLSLPDHGDVKVEQRDYASAPGVQQLRPDA